MLLTLYLFFVGLFLGSFLLVVIDRFCRGISFVQGRSECEFCHHTLSVFDLIPVFSYLFLKGKCKYCHKKLSVIYPLAEILTALFLTFSLIQLFDVNAFFLSFEQSILFLISLFLLVTFILTVFIDIKCGIIPFFVVIPSILIVLISNVMFPHIAPHYFVFSGAGAFLFLFALFLGTKGRGMGFGDCVFALLMGFLLGFPNIITAFYIAFLTGAFVSLILILWRKKRLKNGTIPFGPFLVLGTYLTFLYGNYITGYFLTLIMH